VIEERLMQLNIELPNPSSPGANYVPFDTELATELSDETLLAVRVVR
jgi:hypothetical protein